MKPITKKILIGASIAVVVGIIISFLVLAVAGANIGVSYIKGEGFVKNFEETGKKTTYDLDIITDIEMNVDARKVKLIESDKFAVEYSKTPRIEHSVENGKLIVTVEEYRVFFDNNIIGLTGVGKEEVKIYYPKGAMFNMINIASDLGEIDINSLNAKSINLKLGMGNCNLTGVKSNNVTIDSDNGSVDIKETVIESSAEIDLNMGSLTIKDSNLNNSELTCDLGSINTKDSTVNNARIDTDGGSTKFSNVILTGITEIESSMGEVNLKINGSRENYIVNTNVELGSTNIDGSNPASAENSINIKSDLGSISVSFTK